MHPSRSGQDDISHRGHSDPRSSPSDERNNSIPPELTRIICYCDGGVHHNGKPDATTYGSWLIELPWLEGKVRVSRLSLKGKTNNEAEYEILLELLRALEVNGFHDRKILIHSDSQLICNQVNGFFELRKESLRPLFSAVKEALARLKAIGNVIELRNVPRDIIVEKLGH